MSNYNLVATTRFINIATTTKPELKQVLQSQEQILQQSLAIFTAIDNYKDILKQQASPKNKAASQRLFKRPQNHKKTIPRYSQTFIRLLCYIIYITPKVDEDIETGVTFSKLQLLRIRNIQEAVAVLKAENNNKLNIVLLVLIISLLY